MRCLLRIILCLAVGWLAASSIAWADGCAFYVDRSAQRPLQEREQVAAIAYHDGREKLTLAVRLDMARADKGLWIFPVPGSPTTTNVSLSDRFPEFRGSSPTGQLADYTGYLLSILRATQIWPIPFLMPSFAGKSAALDNVSEQVDKDGLHSEIITAQSSAVLAQTLTRQGVVVTAGQLTTLTPYLAGGYVLVATWIASADEYAGTYPTSGQWLGHMPCVTVDFATPKAFFPLKPTRVYGDAEVPAKLYVIGYVSPETSARVRTSVTYYRSHYDWRGMSDQQREYEQSRHDKPDPVRAMAGLPPLADLRYTRVEIHAQAKNYTDDLWFTPTHPLKTEAAEVLMDHLPDQYTLSPSLFLFAALANALFSYVSAGCAGWLLFRRWRGYAAVGLWNVLSIVGLLFAVYVLDARKQQFQTGGQDRTNAFCGRFTLIFVALTFLVQLAFSALLYV